MVHARTRQRASRKLAASTFVINRVRILIPGRYREALILCIATPQVFNNTNCTTPDLPGVGLPGGYKTFPVMGMGLLPSDDPIDSYELYGLRVRQPIPFLLTTEFHDEGVRTATELLCVAPNEVMKGSREPKGDFPPSAAGGLDIKGAAVLAVGVWSVMGLLLG